MKTFIKHPYPALLLALFLGTLLLPGFSNAATIDLQVSSSADDGYTYLGILNTAGNTIAIDDSSWIVKLYARFQNVTVPKGATIDTASLDFRAYTNYNASSSVYISGVDEDNTVGLSTYADVATRATTTAFTSWSAGNWTANNWYGYTIDKQEIKSIIQEIVDRSGWTSGNALMIVVGNTVPYIYLRRAWSYDQAGNVSGPKLHIEYTTGAPADTDPPVISSINPSNLTESSVQISWTTDEAATTQVEYGPTVSYGSQTMLDPSYLTSHSATLTGLSSATLYHYRVKSQDAVGNLTVSADQTFTTASPPPIVLGWPGWSSINTIYYDPAQDDADNLFLQQAAQELQAHLQKVGKSLSFNTSAKPGSGAIYLEVNPLLAELVSRGDEASRLYTATNGLYITGKTAIAVRHGAYTLLDKLGFRWFFKDSAWIVAPSSLLELGIINETQEPDFFARIIGFWPNINGGDSTTEQWIARNRMGSAKWYRQAENFLYIYPISNYASDLASFCGNAPGWPWQLQPTSQNVVNAATNYVSTFLDASPVTPSGLISPDRLKYGGVPVIPNDGGLNSWQPCYNDSQSVTDAYYSLLNAVADNIKNDYPDDYVVGLSYADYAGVPNLVLRPNILIYLATDYDFSGVGWAGRLAGLGSKGVKLGVRDYYDVWDWWHDGAPNAAIAYADALSDYYANNITALNAEASDNWAPRGLVYYIAARKTWDTSLNTADILSDFYTKAFGNAASAIQDYYENRASSLQVAFQDLNKALNLATGDEDSLERIRQLLYFEYWHLRQTQGFNNLTQSQLEEVYILITKTRQLSILNYTSDEPEIRVALKNNFPGTYPNDSAVYSLLRDPNLNSHPTLAETANYLSQAMNYYAGAIPWINLYTIDFSSLGDSSKAVFAPLSGTTQTILVKSDGNETITVVANGGQSWASANLAIAGPLVWYDTNGDTLASYSVSGTQSNRAYNFNVTEPGLYKITFSYNADSVRLDVPNKPAALAALKTSAHNFFFGPHIQYFFVPEGTPSFNFNAVPVGTNSVSGTLTDPTGRDYNFSSDSETVTLQIDNPVAGLWTLNWTASYEVHLYFFGIPSLIWHNPATLLVEQGTVPPSPIIYTLGDLNQDGKVDLFDVSMLLSRWGSTSSADLSLVDINAGPNNTSQGKIDIFDANLIMRNWSRNR